MNTATSIQGLCIGLFLGKQAHMKGLLPAPISILSQSQM